MFTVNQSTSLIAQIQDLEALASYLFRQAEREHRTGNAEASVRSNRKAIEAEDQAAVLRTELAQLRSRRSARNERYIANLIAAQKLAHWALSQQARLSA